MNCVEAQKYFPDLMDDSRDERLRKVTDHLTACSRCTQELAAIAACQRLVSNLPPVEPPPAFTTRVMAEVRDTAHRSALWQRLFLPLRIKLPLQATAVVLISVVAVFIYQRESRQREFTTTVPAASPVQRQDERDKGAPSASRAPALESKVQKPGAAATQETQLNPSTQSEQLRSPAKPEAHSKIIDGTEPGGREIAPPQESGGPASDTPSGANEKSSSPGNQSGSVRQEQSLPLGGAQAKGASPPALSRNNDAPVKDRTLSTESTSPADLKEKRAVASLDALSSRTTASFDRELILRLKGPAHGDKNTAAPAEPEGSQTGSSPSQAQFKDFEQGRQRAIETGQPQTAWAIIGAGQYDGFKKELAGLGNIESEAPAPAYEVNAGSKSSDQLRIKITILPPNSAAAPPSTR
jgi:hypothetical protein